MYIESTDTNRQAIAMLRRRCDYLMHLALLLSLSFGFAAGFASKAVASSALDQAESAKSTESTAAADVKIVVESEDVDASGDEPARELSIAPQEYPIYPDDRPIWVDQPDRFEADRAELHVQSVPSISRESSKKSLREQQRIAVTTYLDEFLSAPGAGEQLALSSDRIDLLVDPQRTYDGTLTIVEGQMYQHAAVIVLDEVFHDQMKSKWEELQVGQRLKGLGAVGFGAFCVLAAMTGFLRTISPRKPQSAA